MNGFPQRAALIFLIAGGLAGSFIFGFSVGKQEPSMAEGIINQHIGQPTGVDFSLFWDAWRVLQERFVDPDRINARDMTYGAIEGMVRSLDDPYTIFMTPEDTKKFLDDVAGVFEGVGMEIGIRKGELTVIAPLQGTPAQRAGLRPGDRILKINDTFAGDLTVDEAISFIRGPKGTRVTLSIFRDEWEKPQDVTMERAVIEIPSLAWELKEGMIASIRIFHFSQNATGDFKKTVEEILASPATRIILDVRNNPGGFLEVAQDIAGWFLENGSVVTIEDFGKGEEQKKYLAQGSAKLLSYPMIVLINQGSASASEILAGALRDNRGIKLIGEQSFGKGSVQEFEHLRDTSSLKITVANWLTPKGELITDKGLEPDIVVERTGEDYEQGRDPQLDKAVELIKNL